MIGYPVRAKSYLVFFLRREIKDFFDDRKAQDSDEGTGYVLTSWDPPSLGSIVYIIPEKGDFGRIRH